MKLSGFIPCPVNTLPQAQGNEDEVFEKFNLILYVQLGSYSVLIAFDDLISAQ